MAMLLAALSIGTITYLLWNSARYLMTFSSLKIGLVCWGVLEDFRNRTLPATFCLIIEIQLSNVDTSRLYLVAKLHAQAFNEASISLTHLE